MKNQVYKFTFQEVKELTFNQIKVLSVIRQFSVDCISKIYTTEIVKRTRLANSTVSLALKELYNKRYLAKEDKQYIMLKPISKGEQFLYWIDNDLSLGLTYNQFVLYCLIRTNSSKFGYAMFKYSTISNLTGIADTHISRTMKQLIKKELIRIEKQDTYTKYWIIEKLGCENMSKELKKQEVAKLYQESSQENKQLFENKTENNANIKDKKEKRYIPQQPSGKILYSDLLFKDKMLVGGLYLASGQKTKTLIPNVHFYFYNDLAIDYLLYQEIIIKNKDNLKKQFPYKFNLLPSKGRTVHSEVFRPSFSYKDYPMDTLKIWQLIVLYELEDFYNYNIQKIINKFPDNKNLSFKDTVKQDRLDQYKKLIYSYSPAEIYYLIYRTAAHVEKIIEKNSEADWIVPILFSVYFDEMVSICKIKKVLPNNTNFNQNFFSKYFFNVFLEIGEGYFQIPVPTSEELK